MRGPKTLSDLSYIKVFRKLGNDGWLRRHVDCLLWMGLMLNAAYEAEDWVFCSQKHNLKPGQWIGTIRDLSGLIGYTEWKVGQALDRLVADKTIVKQRVGKGLLITICNWDLYQGYNGVDLEALETEPEEEPKTKVDTYVQHKGKYRSPMGGNLDNPIFSAMAEVAAKIIKKGFNNLGLVMSQKVEVAWVGSIKSIMAELVNGKMKELRLDPPLGDHINAMCSHIANDKQLIKKYGPKPWFVEHDYPEIMQQIIKVRPRKVSEEQLREEQARTARQREEDRIALDEAYARRSK